MNTQSCKICEIVKPVADFHQSTKGEVSKGCMSCTITPFKKYASKKALANRPYSREKQAYISALKKEARKDLFHGR